MRITVKFSDGRREELRGAEELPDCDKTREVMLVLDNCDLYRGIVADIDDDFGIMLKSVDNIYFIGLPFDRLVGWFYIDKDNGTLMIEKKTVMSGIKKMIQLGAPGTSTQERFEAGGFQCPQCKGRGYHWGNERDPKREACPRCKGVAG